jgi:DNA polymerase-3 subunit gamma/tau
MVYQTLATEASQNLDQLWQQVIAVLKPFGTQALMKQQGSLLSFDGTAARIGISSKPLFKMAQGRVSNVEEAFQQIVQHPVTVSLEVLPDPKPNEPAPIASGTGVPSVAHPPITEASVPPPSAFSPGPVAPPPAPVPQAGAESPAPDPGSPTSSAEGNDDQAAAPTASPLPEIATDFERAVKNFAQFFNGQVVDMEDDVDALISGGRQPSEAAARQPSHADKDVPF